WVQRRHVRGVDWPPRYLSSREHAQYCSFVSPESSHPMPVTVAAAQFACTEDRAENLARAERLIREAARQGANIVLVQELFETPYFCKEHDPSHFSLALPIADNPAVQRFQALARELDVVLPVSVFER